MHVSHTDVPVHVENGIDRVGRRNDASECDGRDEEGGSWHGRRNGYPGGGRGRLYRGAFGRERGKGRKRDVYRGAEGAMVVAVATHVSSLNFLRTMASLKRALLPACERSESRGGGGECRWC